MKAKIRHNLTVFLFGIILLVAISIGATAFAQSLEGFVTEGESYDSLLIGKSTESDVLAVYGRDYKLINHKGYSYEMIYKNLGLSFYYCAADPNKEIFVVEMQPPSKAVTLKGIKLGESTFAEVAELYGDGGEIYSEGDYDGIYFYSGVDDEEDDSEDARNQPQSTVIEEPAIETLSEPRGAVIDQSNFVLDGADVSADSNDQEDSNNKAESSVNEIPQINETPQVDKNQADEKKDAKRKEIVKRIELVEKDGLRQCDSKFPKN